MAPNERFLDRPWVPIVGRTASQPCPSTRAMIREDAQAFKRISDNVFDRSLEQMADALFGFKCVFVLDQGRRRRR